MRVSKRAIATAAALAAIATVTFSVESFGAAVGDQSAAAGAADRYVPKPRGNMTLAQAKAFTPYALYHAGSSPTGLPLVAVNRVGGTRSDEPGVYPDRVSFLYGTCSARRGQGCMPPLQLQIWNACERYQALYPFEPDESLEIRGVPAAFYEGKTRLELYSGMVTVVVFGESREQLIIVARSLRGLNRATQVADRLPGPAQDVRHGTLDCQQ